jgi:hypothetical protein
MLTQLELDSKTPLYADCNPEEPLLKEMLNLLQMNGRHKWRDASLDENLTFWLDLLPKGNMYPSSIEEAKKIMCPLDLPHDKYHTYINDCILYQNEVADRTICLVCKAARYKDGKKYSQKVVWYFPLIPHLQRYLVDRKKAKLMHWQWKGRRQMMEMI